MENYQVENYQIENYQDYDYNYNFTLIEPSSTIWMNISDCVAVIAIFLFSGLLTTAIFLDRRAYEKTRSFLLLNYMFNYILFALFYYFHNVHIHIFRDLLRSSCLFIILLTSVTNEGALYFILPICCDFIVKYFKPSKYESQSFLRIQIIFIVVLWAFIWVKELLIVLAFSDYGSDHCYIHLHLASLCLHLSIVILYIITMLVFVCLLIYITVKSRGNDMMKLSLRTMIVVTVFVIISYSAEIVLFVGMYGIISNSFYVPHFLNMIRFVVVPFLFLFDPTIRQSTRKLCLGKCRKSTDTPSHELTTELK